MASMDLASDGSPGLTDTEEAHMAWYIESADANELLPIKPVDTFAEARLICAQIGEGRPVELDDITYLGIALADHCAPEPQEMTNEWFAQHRPTHLA